MNIQLSNTEEIVEGKEGVNLGQVLIRWVGPFFRVRGICLGMAY